MTLSLCTASRNRLDGLKKLYAALVHAVSHEACEWLIAESYDVPEPVRALAGPDVVRCWPPAGATAALNTIFPMTRGEFVALLADDTIPDTGVLLHAVQFMRDHPVVGQGAFYVRTPTHRCHVPPWHGWMYAQYWMVRREVGEQVGWYEPSCHHASVDNDFSAKILSAGYGVVAIPGACVADAGLHTSPPEAEEDTRRIEAKWHDDQPALKARWDRDWKALSGSYECGRPH